MATVYRASGDSAGLAVLTRPAQELVSVARAVVEDIGGGEVSARVVHTATASVDLDESVRRSVAALRTEPALLHRDRVRGAVVDLATGVVREVGATA